MSENFTHAITAYKKVVGNENVIMETSVLKQYETTTFQTKNKIPAIIRPKNTREVQACLKIANQYKTPVYPVSTGMNVGYGSKVPTANASIILELKRMNQIIDFNKDLAYITIEPGVSQQQLYDFLQDKNSDLWMDATGAFASHSIIGNIAERGFGHTPYGDHFANVGGMEVVLPTGECIKTGFGRYPNAKAAGVYRWGVGPYIDGLFTQSNYGIITQITLWLMPKPEYFQGFYFSVEHHEQLEEIIEQLKPLRLNGTINSAMHIANDYKVLSSIQLYPWERTGGKTPLTKQTLKEFSKEWDFGAWNASGAIYGTRQEVASARKIIRKQLKGRVKKLRFIDERLLKLAEIFHKPYSLLTGMNLTDMLRIIRPVFGMIKGVPTNEMIPSTYWRKKTPQLNQQINPDQDGCGLLWCAPISPTNGKFAIEMWQIVEQTFERYEFEPAISLTLLTERSMDCVIGISYDRQIPGEDQRAQDCHDEVLKKLTYAGYYPYRLGIQSMKSLKQANSHYEKLLKQIKTSLDPNNILSPGRYDT